MRFEILGHRAFDQKEDDTFTFSNTDPFTKNFAILADNWVNIAFPALTRVDSTNMTDPNQLVRYEQLVRDKRENPKKIFGIRLLTTNVAQFDQGMNWQSRDSDGEAVSVTDHPINMLSPMQFQTILIDVPFENLLVGLNEFMVYPILPNTSVTMTFCYRDFKIRRLLNMQR